MRRSDPVASAASRRGMVVGLTLAEIMLLLTFCLVMASAAGISHERDLRRQAETARDAAVAEAGLARAEGPLAGLVAAESARTGAATDDVWRRLVEGGRALSPRDGGEPNPAAARGQAAGPGPANVEQAAAESPAQARKEAGREEPARPEGFVAAVTQAVAGLGRSLSGKHDWPPIVTLSEAAGFRFASGSPALSPDFMRRLRAGVVPRLIATGESYDVDVIEVIGHTDGQPLTGPVSNLDATLVGALRGLVDPSRLQAGDNAGLGLARAATVAAELRRDRRLDGFRIVPLSAGQATDRDGRIARSTLPDAALRRIEVRMRKGTAQSE